MAGAFPVGSAWRMALEAIADAIQAQSAAMARLEAEVLPREAEIP